MLCCPIAQLPSFIGGLNGLKESQKNFVVFWMTAEDHGVDDCAGSNKPKIVVSTEKPGTSFRLCFKARLSAKPVIW